MKCKRLWIGAFIALIVIATREASNHNDDDDDNNGSMTISTSDNTIPTVLGVTAIAAVTAISVTLMLVTQSDTTSTMNTDYVCPTQTCPDTDDSNDWSDYDVGMTVETRSGKVKGTMAETPDGTMVHEFYNVPYATPPVGLNRWQAPKIMNEDNAWTGTFDASLDTTIKCIQYTTGDGQEDCLRMTIRSTDLSASKPVIVWIHGGGVMFNWGNKPGYSFDAEMTGWMDVVTVNVNYRLGLLGFNSIDELWNEDEGVYANNGIRDQIAALTWIQDNIANFGGDPNSVTLIGESGGGTSLLAILSSSMANGKYHRAFVMSAGVEMRTDHTVGDGFQQDSMNITEQVGCLQDTLEDRRNCLMTVPANYFTEKKDGQPGKIANSITAVAYFDFPMRYGEVYDRVGMLYVDGEVINQAPRELASATNPPDNRVPVIISNLAEESGLLQVFAGMNVFSDDGTVNDTMRPLFDAILNPSVDSADYILNKIYSTMYPDMSPQEKWNQVVTDLRVTCPTNDVAEAMSQSSHHDIYRMYITNHMENMPAYHTWDTDALFGFLDWEETEKDIAFRMSMIEILKQFAHYNSLPDAWGTYPGHTMTMTNDIDNIQVVIDGKPQEDICEEWRAMSLVDLGWQN